jgi:hypothetical protein
MSDIVSRHWLHALIAAILAGILFVIMLGIFPDGAATMPKSYGGSVLALEFARTLPDVRAIFGNGDDPAQIARITMMTLGTWHDMLFAVLYTAFLCFLGLALLQVADWRALYAVPVLAIIAGLSDLLENWMLLDVLESFRSGGLSPWLAKLGWPVWMKFISLGLAGSLLGIGLASLDGVWKWLGYIVAILSLPITILAFIMPYWLAGVMAAGVGISWLILFGSSIWGSVIWFRNR